MGLQILRSVVSSSTVNVIPVTSTSAAAAVGVLRRVVALRPSFQRALAVRQSERVTQRRVDFTRLEL